MKTPYTYLVRALLPIALSAVLAAPAACGSSSSDTPGTGGPGGDGPDAGGGTLPDGAPKPGTDASTNPDGSKVTAGGIKTVFLIVMENHTWATIKASPSSKYITGTLLPMGAHAEAYSTVAGIHPSLPNYLWLEAGDNFKIKDDNPPSANHQATKDHLTAQLDAKGITWKAYAEGMTAGTCPLTAGGTYDPKHTPQLYFDDVTGTNDASSAYCKAHVKVYSELATDLTAGTVARYNFITPDLCNDMHGNGFGAGCGFLAGDDAHIKLGDDWLAAEIPKILASAAYKDNGVIFILWDEGDAPALQTSADGPIGMIAISPLAKAKFSSNTAFTHSSMFRTLQTIFGVPFLRGAVGSNDLGEMFTTFP